jgi:4'-phosphopantetheinyl transferase
MAHSTVASSSAESLRVPDDGVDLWYCRPAIFASDTSLLARYEGLIDADEYEHYRRLRLPDHKLEYLASHALLRYVLTLYYPGRAPSDWVFQRNSHGKPSLVAEQADELGIAFNLSHTNGMGLCAVAPKGEVGVDVEYHANSQGLLDVADHYFSDTEVEDLFRLPKDEQENSFFHYWTLKEAFIKARGEGLAIPLDSFSFVFRDGGITFVPPENALLSEQQWNFKLFHPGERYTAAVAWDHPFNSLRLFEATPLLSHTIRDPLSEWL